MSSMTPTVTEKDTLPAVAGTDSWESIGRQLLRAKLEHVGEVVVRDAFQQAASRIGADESLTGDDIRELRQALETAEAAVSLAATASPETAPLPDAWEFLDGDGRSAYVDEVERRREH